MGIQYPPEALWNSRVRADVEEDPFKATEDRGRHFKDAPDFKTRWTGPPYRTAIEPAGEDR